MKSEVAGAIGTVVLSTVLAPDHWGLLNTLVACAGGAYGSFALRDPVTPRSRMAQVFIMAIIMGWAFSTILNAVIGAFFHNIELTVGFRAAVGAVMSCLVPFWLPSLIEKVNSGEWVYWIPFINKKD